MRYARKQRSSRMPRFLIAVVLTIAIVIGSVVTAMANSVDITVYDEENTYTFSLLSADAESILARAETEGMPPVSDIDSYEYDAAAGTLIVNRAVRISVLADHVSQSFIVDKGMVLADALEECGVELGERDVTEPERDTVLTADTYVSVTRSNRVYVNADGECHTEDVLDGTVADALEAANVVLGEKDTVTPEADTALIDGMLIHVARYITVTVTADGETVTKNVTAHSYAEAAEETGVTLGGEDRIYVKAADEEETLVERDDAVEDGAELRIERISTEELVLEENIDYKTVYKDSSDLYEDETKTEQNGTDGTKKVTYKVTYAEGVEVSREVVKEETTQEAKDKVVLRGTKERPKNAFTDSTGATVSYEYCLTGNCTAYSWDAGSVTSLGESVRVGYVAVDPNVIPYGSLLYITSPYGEWDYGYCYAMDTGSAARSGQIIADLFYDTEEECNAFGRRVMNVYVIRAGW